MAQLDRLLKAAVSERASDLHLSADEAVRFRVDGDIVEFEDQLSSKMVHDIIYEILTDQEKQKLASSKNLDRSYSVEGFGNFRVNIFYTRRGLAAVLRSIPSKIPTMTELGLPPTLEKLTELPKGLVLVTGPTGSGKSTTLAAMINHINLTCKYHILTVEDPIEFVHTSQKSLINQREIGNHCATFTDALKYALREDPDVILVGEMRDLETISLALTAAETGHLVFGTLHTRGSSASVDRIIDSFPSNQQAMIRAMLSESLAAVISQALIKKADGRGRKAAYEILISNHAISNLIREGKTFQMTSVIQTARKEGMILMDQHITELVAAGIINPEEAMAYMEDPTPVMAILRAGRPKVQSVLTAIKPENQVSVTPATGEAATAVPPTVPPAPSSAAAPTAPPKISTATPAAKPPEMAKRPASPPASQAHETAPPKMAPTARPAARPAPRPMAPPPPAAVAAMPEEPQPQEAPLDEIPSDLGGGENTDASLFQADSASGDLENEKTMGADDFGDGATLTNISPMPNDDMMLSHAPAPEPEEATLAAETEGDDLSSRAIPEEVFEHRLPDREETSTFEIPSLKKDADPKTETPPPPPRRAAAPPPPARPAAPAPLRTTPIPPPPPAAKATPTPVPPPAGGKRPLPPPPPPPAKKKAG